MTFSDNIIQKFKEITGYDLIPFFTVSSAILSRFSRSSDDLNVFLMPRVKSALNQLKITIIDINRNFDINRHALGSDIRFFELIENIDIIESSIDTLLNANKWGKFFKNSLLESQSPEMNYIIRQNETLEQIAYEILNSDNFLDSWFDIAYDNDLEEEKYTSEGNVFIKLPLRISGLKKLQIDSIIDLIDEETIKGKDIAKKLSFIDNDLNTVTGLDCALQSCEILAGLKQGDNPDFPEHGISKNFVVGVSSGFLNYPVIVRQLNSNFDNDDSFSEFNIISFKQIDDSVLIDYEVKTRTNEIINQQLQF